MHPHDYIAVADSIAVISVDVLARRGKQTVLPLMLFSLFWLCLTTVDMLQGLGPPSTGRRPFRSRGGVRGRTQEKKEMGSKGQWSLAGSGAEPRLSSNP